TASRSARTAVHWVADSRARGDPAGIGGGDGDRGAWGHPGGAAPWGGGETGIRPSSSPEVESAPCCSDGWPCPHQTGGSMRRAGNPRQHTPRWMAVGVPPLVVVLAGGGGAAA